MKKLSVYFLQLPVPDVNSAYSEANIPLAAGYLTALAQTRYPVDQFKAFIPTDNFMNHANDQRVIHSILESDAELVCFTNYMWNIERHLFIAREVKERNSRIKTIFGGPEIAQGSPFINASEIDCHCFGEGETIWLTLLDDWYGCGVLKPAYYATHPIDPGQLPNPYLAGILSINKTHSALLETMRGCPYHCHYCFYGKSNPDLRFFPEIMIADFFQYCQQHLPEEIYLLDPSFNLTPNLIERLKKMAGWNKRSIPIHTEIRLESLTDEAAEWMKKAGFRSIEVGLQTTHRQALEAINRKWSRSRFIQGARYLQARDIDIKTGVILGLPLDRFSDFQKTIEFVDSLNLSESMEVYPLSLLPGTYLREQAQQLGIKFMKLPPYWVTQTPSFGSVEMIQAIAWLEDLLSIDYYPAMTPTFSNSVTHHEFISSIDFREKNAQRWQRWTAMPLANHLTLIFKPEDIPDSFYLQARELVEKNPFMTFQIVLAVNEMPSISLAIKIANTFYNPDHYLNRLHYFKNDTQKKYSARIYHLTSSPISGEKYLENPQPFDLIIDYRPGMLQTSRNLFEGLPIVLLNTQISIPEIQELKAMYRGFENLLIMDDSNSRHQSF